MRDALIFENSRNITITFSDEYNNFGYYKSLFNSMSSLDKLHSRFLTDTKENVIKVQSSVKSISMKSPMDIVVFIQEYWYETLLFVFASYDKIRSNGELIFNDIKDLVKSYDHAIGYLDFKLTDYSYTQLQNVLNWFNNLTLSAKMQVERLIKSIGNQLKHINNIVF
jgi:hypothetical protein